MNEVNTLEVPYSLEAEEAVIGSLLVNPDSIVKVLSWLQPRDFHTEWLGKTYEVISGMYERNIPCDVLLLHEELKRLQLLEVINLGKLMGITSRTPTFRHIRYYGRIVLEHGMRRALLSAGGNIGGLAYRDSVGTSELMGMAGDELREVFSRAGSEEGASSEQLADAFLTRLDGLDPALGVGLLTGYHQFDRLTGGLYAGQLVVIAGRPGTGKTSLAANIADHVLQQSEPAAVQVFSLEMTQEEWFAKHVSLRTGVPTDRFRQTDSMSESEIQAVADAVGKLASSPLHVDDKSDLTITGLMARARRAKEENGTALVIVDYLQLVKGSNQREKNRAIEVGEVARGLKELAKSAGVPVIALAQLNREIESRPKENRVPQLSDLRESGEIEQAADIVIMLHHDPEREHICDLHVKKHRNGPTPVIGLYWEANCTRFDNVAWGRQG